MISRNKFLVLFLFISTWLAVATSPTSAEVVIPDMPVNYVVDLAGIINDNVEANLNRYLLELEQKTTAQMIVLTINSLEGESLGRLSIETAEKWKLGKKDRDNGVLLLIALQDGKYRFEIGYGLEGILPDSHVGSIGRKYLAPYFQKGDYSTGIFTATLAVINIIASDAGAEISGMPRLKSRSPSVERRKPTLLSIIFTILFLMGLIYLAIKHPRLFMFLLIMSMMGGGRRGGWSGGGGFGGGGGGGFGGGGASGGW